MNTRKYFNQLLANGDLDKLFYYSDKHHADFGKELGDKFILQSARYSTLKEDFLKGFMSKEDRSIGLARITSALAKMVPLIPKDHVINIPEIDNLKTSLRTILIRSRWLILGVFWSLILLTGIIMAFSFKKDIRVILEIESSRIQFEIKEKAELEIANGFGYDFITISGFDKIDIPAARYELVNADHDYIPLNVLSNRQSVVYPIDGKESDMGFENAVIENIKLSEGADVILDTREELDQEEILSLIATGAQIAGNLIMQDSLYFQSNFCRIENLSDSSFQKGQDFLEGLIIGFFGQVLELPFESNTGIFALDLESKADVPLNIKQKKRFQLTELRFEIPKSEGYTISSIIGGKVQFLDQSEQGYYALEVEAGQFINLSGKDEFELLALDISGKKMNLKVAGYINQLKAGNTAEALKIQNPTILKWFWTNHTILVLTFLFLAVGISLVLIFLRKIR